MDVVGSAGDLDGSAEAPWDVEGSRLGSIGGSVPVKSGSAVAVLCVLGEVEVAWVEVVGSVAVPVRVGGLEGTGPGAGTDVWIADEVVVRDPGPIPGPAILVTYCSAEGGSQIPSFSTPRAHVLPVHAGLMFDRW